jgi:hypothetical protein
MERAGLAKLWIVRLLKRHDIAGSATIQAANNDFLAVTHLHWWHEVRYGH